MSHRPQINELQQCNYGVSGQHQQHHRPPADFLFIRNRVLLNDTPKDPEALTTNITPGVVMCAFL
eukprot:scaffold51297_cov52-Cyclotella_meneghiniana.AAC.7